MKPHLHLVWQLIAMAVGRVDFSGTVLGMMPSPKDVVATQRQLSYERIAGSYEPVTRVTDAAALDLDLFDISGQLALMTNDGFAVAQAIYQKGGNSMSIARIVLYEPLPANIPKGSPVEGTDASGGAALGTMYYDAPLGSTELSVLYTPSDIQAQHLSCRVGGLPSQSQMLDGCFAPTGSVTVEGYGTFQYVYNTVVDNTNGRTIQGLSTSAQQKMYHCSACPYPEYQKFYEYYGAFDYANEIVLAALAGNSTSFSRGNLAMASYSRISRSEVAKKAMSSMHVFMYVIRQMEHAISGCREDDPDAVHAWDEAVAYYAGSLEGSDGSGTGVFPYSLADKRCANFQTCGVDGNATAGTSRINDEVMKEFTIGAFHIMEGRCESVLASKTSVARRMTVPLVQSALRYVHRRSALGVTHEKTLAQSAIFAASVVPFVHACSEEDAQIIYVHSGTQSADPFYGEVKAAFERNYDCMGITCEDVGGLFDEFAGGYFQGAEPCRGKADDAEQPPTAAASSSAPVSSAPAPAPTGKVATSTTAPTKSPFFIDTSFAGGRNETLSPTTEPSAAPYNKDDGDYIDFSAGNRPGHYGASRRFAIALVVLTMSYFI
uniref:Uncharacterized protein n=1 Tax=Odontella aurita TaxID=265563 RepID=A0A7S4JUU1_9STRA|mmetsp:Transcript_54639/g.163298  ORF Transcript_54639/g.163298 Transcript_54639/m.163298 type:complete len:604 (+) Transcript_54639:256-2067(+)